MQEKIIPKICEPGEDGTPAAYEGHVMLRMPDFEERMGLFEAYGIAIEDGDDSNMVTGRVLSKGNLALIRFLIRQLPHWIDELAIKRLDDGHEFTSWDEAKYDSDVGAIAPELAWRLIGKYRVGNGSQPS